MELDKDNSGTIDLTEFAEGHHAACEGEGGAG